MSEQQNKRTEISEFGEFGLIEHLTKDFKRTAPTTIFGVGDDAAVIEASESEYALVTTDLLLEGINFNLVYTPLAHLGYKTIVVGISDIYAMNGTPHQAMISIGVSAKLCVEQLEEFYSGVKFACESYGVDLVGGDTSASITGFTISVTVVGRVAKDQIVYRSGAKNHDLICVTGDLGAAYMGLHLLERENRALKGVDNPQPKFDGYEYLLKRQLKPEAPMEVLEALRLDGIKPTSMIDLSDGLASDMLQICKSSNVGARIYLDRLPIAQQTFRMAEELNADPVMGVLNGGDDYELLFTVPLADQEKIFRIPGVDVIGHIVEADQGAALTTPDGAEIPLTAQGWVKQTK